MEREREREERRRSRHERCRSGGALRLPGMLAAALLGSLGAGHATLPPTCQPNSRPPTDSVTLAPNYFSCNSKRLPGKFPIRSWVRRTGCVDLTTGEPLDCDLCVGSWVDPGSELGHQHDPQRGNKIFYARGTVWSDTQPFSEIFTSTGFTLRTLRGKPRVVFTAPEAAARVRLSAWAFLHERDYRFVCAPHVPGERWTCPDPSRTQASYDFAMNFLPAIDNRAQLPASATYLRCDYFYKCRATGQDSQGNPPHGSNMYGEAGFLKALQALAASFRAFKDKQGNQPFQHYKLMIGDISLERGGVFDLNQDWSPPHCRHRVGRSADISRYVWDERANTFRELDEDQRKTFLGRICDGKGRLHCGVHGSGPSLHFHVEYKTFFREQGAVVGWSFKPNHTSIMPCPWPHALTGDDTCPVQAVLPQ